MLIGIRGEKGHGKDALALALTYRLPGVTYTLAFASALKRAAMDMYGLSFEQCFGPLSEKEAVDPRWGLSPREILQRLGTEVGRSVHPETWTRKLLDDAEAARTSGARWICDHNGWRRVFRGPRAHYILVPDTRFPNEVDAIHGAGGVVIQVIRPGFRTGAFEEHASETALNGVPADYTVVNDGDLPLLAQKADQAVAWILAQEAFAWILAQEALTAAAPSGRGMGNGDEPS